MRCITLSWMDLTTSGSNAHRGPRYRQVCGRLYLVGLHRDAAGASTPAGDPVEELSCGGRGVIARYGRRATPADFRLGFPDTS